MFVYCKDKHIALYSEDKNLIESAYRVIDDVIIVNEVPKGTNVHRAIGSFIRIMNGGCTG